ncbi:MAG: hypothetical protein ABI597_04095 [Gammaproteobacteria bacterium]
MFTPTHIAQCRNTIKRISPNTAPLVLAAMNELMNECEKYTDDDQVQVVENMLTTKEAAVRKMKGDTRSKDSLAIGVFNLLQKAIANYKELKFPVEEKAIKTSPHWREHSLRMQQELLMASDEFLQTLKEMEKYAARYHSLPGSILIAYAVPSKAHASYIDWTEKFVTTLQKQLIAAGFASTELAIDHRSRLDIESCGRVILIGTELLLSAKDTITADLIGNIYNRAQEANQRSKPTNIIPIVISGDAATSLPPSFTRMTPAILNDGEPYLQHVYKLIKQLYQSHDDGLDKILESFLTNLRNNKDTKKQQLAFILEKGLDESAVLAKVNVEIEEADIAKQHAYEASMRLLSSARSSTSSERLIRSMLPEVKQNNSVNPPVLTAPPSTPVSEAILPPLSNSALSVVVSSVDSKANNVTHNESSDYLIPRAPGGPSF